MKQAQVPREFMFLKYEFSSLYKHNKPNSTITAKFKQSTRSVTINLDRFYSSTSSMNSGRNYEYLTLSSTDCSGIICKIYGQTKNDMDLSLIHI